MHFFVDAYNIFFRTSFVKKGDSFHTSREKFIQFYDERLINVSGSHTFIFDGKRCDAFAVPSVFDHGNIEIVFSPPDLSADDYIIEWLSHHKATYSICLVTDDKGLLNRARPYRVKLMSINAYISFLNKKRNIEEAKSEDVENVEEIKRLEAIFKKKV